jgi:hypothetical protein
MLYVNSYHTCPGGRCQGKSMATGGRHLLIDERENKGLFRRSPWWSNLSIPRWSGYSRAIGRPMHHNHQHQIQYCLHKAPIQPIMQFIQQGLQKTPAPCLQLSTRLLFSILPVPLFMNRPPGSFVLVTQNCTRRSVSFLLPRSLRFGVNHVCYISTPRDDHLRYVSKNAITIARFSAVSN